MKFKLEMDMDKMERKGVRIEIIGRLEWVAEMISLSPQIGGTIFSSTNQEIGKYYLDRSS